MKDYQGITIKMKRCSKCKTYKELLEFNKNRARYDGYSNYCRECDHERGRTHYEKYKEQYREKHRKYQKDNKNREIFRRANRKFCNNNRHKINLYKYDRYCNDIEYKLLAILRTRLISGIKGERKADTTKRLLGCSIEEFKLYLESKFDKKMNWENFGSYWHIDHIIPCVSFNLTDLEEQKKCFHYTNLQPLEAMTNIKKSDFLDNGKRGRWNKT